MEREDFGASYAPNTFHSRLTMVLSRLTMALLAAFVALIVIGRTTITRNGRVFRWEVDEALSAVALATPLSLSAWLYRAYANLPALGARQLRTTPGLAAVSVFIPFYNLVRPFQHLGELWRASDPDPEDPGDAPGRRPGWPVSIVWAWASAVNLLLIGACFREAARRGHELPAELVGTITDILWTQLGIALFSAVRAIWRRQQQRSERLSAPI